MVFTKLMWSQWLCKSWDLAPSLKSQVTEPMLSFAISKAVNVAASVTQIVHLCFRYRGPNDQQQYPKRTWINQNGFNGVEFGGPTFKKNFNNKGPMMKGSFPGQTLKKPIWDLSALPPFPKNFYQPALTVANRYTSFQNCRNCAASKTNGRK